MYFNPIQERDLMGYKNAMDSLKMACSQNGGIEKCTCLTDHQEEVGHPENNITATFFCLPEKCECADGTTEEIQKPVRNYEAYYRR